MTPEQADALARRIATPAALLEDVPATVVESEAVEASRAVREALREASGGLDAVSEPTDPDEASDAELFSANSGRTVRLRPHQPGDPRPPWAGEGQPLMSVVRNFRSNGVVVDPLPAEAFAGRRGMDDDAAILAAVRAAHGRS